MTDETTIASDTTDSNCGCAFGNLLNTVRVLRDPGGCPWDAEQTHNSLRSNLLEEAYEALEAIDSEDPANLEEELGDLLIQIAFHADIAERLGEFDAHSVCDKVAQKLQSRHPHVFGLEDPLETAEDVVDRWEQLKRIEAGGTRSIVASVPNALPALAQAGIIQRRAARAGLDVSGYGSDTPIAPDPQSRDVEKRAGEYLLAVVRQVQALGVDPEVALLNASRSVKERVLRTESLAEGTPLADLSEERRERLWREADQAATST